MDICKAAVVSNSVSTDADIKGSLKYYNTSSHLAQHESHLTGRPTGNRPYHGHQMLLRERSDQIVSQDQFDTASFVTFCHQAPHSAPNEPVTNRI